MKQLSVSYGDEELFDGIPVRFTLYVESESGVVRVEMGPPGGGGLGEQLKQFMAAQTAGKAVGDNKVHQQPRRSRQETP